MVARDRNMEVQTEENNEEKSDVDPSEFNDLLRTVWKVFENQICDDVEAVALLKYAATSISNNETFKKIEEEFKLGALGEYVVGDQEALPFLTTVMSHIHHKIDDDITSAQEDEGNHRKVTHPMTRFWEELEIKMGANDATRSVVDEISEKVSQVAQSLEVENPAFAVSLSEIGDCLKTSWNSLRKEVDGCIRHVRRRKYNEKSMEKIYSRVICKGINTARAIQQKIDSISTRHMI